MSRSVQTSMQRSPEEERAGPKGPALRFVVLILLNGVRDVDDRDRQCTAQPPRCRWRTQGSSGAQHAHTASITF